MITALSSASALVCLETTALDGYIEVTRHPTVADQLLVTSRDAAVQLGAVERTLDRLVACGRLPLRQVERAAQLLALSIHSDLESVAS